MTHQPPTPDLKIQKQYHEKLMMSKFLARLEPTLAAQVHDQLLYGDTVLVLAVAFSTVRLAISEATP